jgi:hypothetical protein
MIATRKNRQEKYFIQILLSLWFKPKLDLNISLEHVVVLIVNILIRYHFALNGATFVSILHEYFTKKGSQKLYSYYQKKFFFPCELIQVIKYNFSKFLFRFFTLTCCFLVGMSECATFVKHFVKSKK